MQGIDDIRSGGSIVKVIVKNDWIYLRADFKNLTSAQHEFMRECYWSYAPWGDFDEDGDSPLYKQSTAKDNERAINRIFELAHKRNVEVSDEVYDVYKTVSLAADEERKKEEEARKAAAHIKELQETVSSAYFWLKHGCASCEHLKYERGAHRCLYADRLCRKSKEEEEYEFYARRESQITGMAPAYFALPYPCAGCKYIEEAQKAQEELDQLTKKE